MKKIVLQSEQDTHNLAKEIAGSLTGGEVIALVGELGAGKTTFTQYLAKELGVDGHVNSPTFVLMKQYKTNKPKIHRLVHVDAYRLSDVSEVYELGLDQFMQDETSVVVIEWADKIKDLLDNHDNVIWMEFELENNTREVKIS